VKITKANVDEMNSILIDMLDDTGQQVREAAEVWLDDENDADERRDARETLDNELDNLRSQAEDLLRVLS
jgi:gas vesicle protein